MLGVMIFIFLLSRLIISFWRVILVRERETMPYQRCPAAVLCIVPTRRSFVQDSGVGRVCAEVALLCKEKG